MGPVKREAIQVKTNINKMKAFDKEILSKYFLG
jgi:hypothetical protein